MTPRIVAATGNTAKVEALRRLLGNTAELIPTPIRIAEIGETGTTVEEIAANKAKEWSRALFDAGVLSLVIASDGGLVIPALGDAWNPLLTRRFAGANATDEERARLLLLRAAHLSGAERAISWREAIAIADSGELIDCWSAEGSPGLLAGELDPTLLEQAGGFWVSALWLVSEFGYRPLVGLNAEERAGLDDHWRRLEAPVREALRIRSHLDATRVTFSTS